MINYNNNNKSFTIRTKDTCYAFKVAHSKYLVHLYYGLNRTDIDCGDMPAKASFTSTPYDLSKDGFSLETIKAEYSYFGTGDYRTTSLRIKNSGGDSNTLFLYEGYRIFNGYKPIEGLPCARGGEKVQTLEITLFDKVSRCRLWLYYKVYYDCNIITRYIKLQNIGKEAVVIENCMSLCLDINGGDYHILSMHGSYGNEMNLKRNSLFYGNQRVISRRGATGHICNPFIAVCDKSADYNQGNVYAFNLIYSGNFLSEAELTAVSTADEEYNLLRIQTGLGSENFCYKLASGECFFSPEAVMTYSGTGLNQMTKNLHEFTRNYILPKETQPKPVVLNTWEACFYNIREDKLLSFSKKCSEIGIDTLVVDDGWFGKRDDDSSSLGDWFADNTKFKNGFKSFVNEVRKYVKFGIWIEPEMISEKSDLYKKHPDWVLGRKERQPSLGRNQYVLDMTNNEVIEYLKKIFIDTFAGLEISYLKWDMNRHLTEVGTLTNPFMPQGEVSFRYMKGVYKLLNWFKETFPNVFLETCSGGGGRYDLGMAAYSSMIWTSDNTFPQRRMLIQSGALTAYPACMMSCHISNPEGICEDETELNYRFVVALQGLLGYEMDIGNISQKTADIIKEQIKKYSAVRHIIENGQYNVVYPPNKNGCLIYYFSLPDEVLLSIICEECENTDLKEIVIESVLQDAVYKEFFTGDEISGQILKNGYKVQLPAKGKYAELKYFVRRQ